VQLAGGGDDEERLVRHVRESYGNGRPWETGPSGGNGPSCGDGLSLRNGPSHFVERANENRPLEASMGLVMTWVAKYSIYMLKTNFYTLFP
jgi:hypothetical protein